MTSSVWFFVSSSYEGKNWTCILIQLREPYSWKKMVKSNKVMNLWKNVCLNPTKPEKQRKMIEKIAIFWHSMRVEPCNLKLLHFATQWNYIVQAHTAINVKNLVKKENTQKYLTFCLL